MLENDAHLAVLALAQAKRQPYVIALLALDLRFHRPVGNALDLDPLGQRSEGRLIGAAEGAHAVTAQPAGRGQFEQALQPAIIGQQQQPLGVEIEAADGKQPRQIGRQIVEDGRAAFGIAGGSDTAARLMIQEKASTFRFRQGLAVEQHLILVADIERRAIDDLAVDADAAGGDEVLGVAARGNAGTRHALGQTLAGEFLLVLARAFRGKAARRPGGAAVGFAIVWHEKGFAAKRGLPEGLARGAPLSGKMMAGETENPWDAAFAAARAALAAGEVPIGAVVVAPDGAIVGRGGNRTLSDCDPSAHAEIVALRQACREAQSARLPEYDLYVTLEPCPMCAAAISFARIRRLYFAAFDPKGGAVENGVRFYEDPSCHHVPECYGGIRESEAAALLKSFFVPRR